MKYNQLLPLPNVHFTILENPLLQGETEKAIEDERTVNLSHPVLIGRGMTTHNMESNHHMLLLNNRILSRNHAEVKYENGRVWLMDLGSTNGTFLNNTRLSEENKKSLWVEVKNNSLIELGTDIKDPNSDDYLFRKIQIRVHFMEQKLTQQEGSDLVLSDTLLNTDLLDEENNSIHFKDNNNTKLYPFLESYEKEESPSLFPIQEQSSKHDNDAHIVPLKGLSELQSEKLNYRSNGPVDNSENVPAKVKFHVEEKSNKCNSRLPNDIHIKKFSSLKKNVECLQFTPELSTISSSCNSDKVTDTAISWWDSTSHLITNTSFMSGVLFAIILSLLGQYMMSY